MFATSSLTTMLDPIIVILPWWGTIDVAPAVSALLIFVGLNTLLYITKHIFLMKFKSWSEKTNATLDDVVVTAIERIRPIVYTMLSAIISLSLFDLPTILEIPLTALFFALLTWQIIEILLVFILYGVNKFVQREVDGVIDPSAVNAAEMIILLARIILWVLGVLFILSNLDIEVTSLIAGLGIGGVAVAFALQGILSDLFASFSIYFDRPFQVGDFVVVGDNAGTVQKIGIKSTRIKTLQGEELVVSNTELTTARVQNFKRMHERRIVMNFGITYETKPELVAKVPGIIRDYFESVPEVSLDRAHFTTFGDSALLFEVVYIVKSADYTEYMNIQQAFNLALMDRFNEKGIAFAYPTQMIYTKGL